MYKFSLHFLMLFVHVSTVFCHKLWFSNIYIFATQFRGPLIFKTMNTVILSSLSLKYLRLTTLVLNDKEIRKFKFVAKLKPCWLILQYYYCLYNELDWRAWADCKQTRNMKPSPHTILQHKGNTLWNSGIFVTKKHQNG